MFMRVISGLYRRRALLAPKGQNTRPTTDRVRESLFQHLELSRLAHGFEGIDVLDLFAGSGSLSFEALSRGARHATLVDSSRDARACQARNADSLECSGRVTLITAPLPRAIKSIRGPFNVVFADPPYTLDLGEQWLGSLPSLLADSGWLVFEHVRGGSPVVPALTCSDVRTYGDTEISLYQRV
ncbi:MAG: 16S rRNA (guanine966-N2)-methyltransferase [Bradymonadia bacterium]|jgi:16S rRNA (guanine966-N2)-methyltransferase